MTLALPKTREVMELVSLLIDEKLILRKGNGWDLNQPNPGACITFLQGRDNVVQGAVLTDLAATLYIGGKLILMPETTLKAQFEGGLADEPVVEAVNEVVNNLRTLYNKIDLNPHVAPTQTFAFQVPGPDDFVVWILNPSQRVDYVWDTALGPATLTLIAP